MGVFIFALIFIYAVFFSIVFIEGPALYGLIFRISFSEYEKDRTYMNVFLLSASSLLLCSIGFMDYLSTRVRFFERNSSIDDFLISIQARSEFAQKAVKQELFKVIGLLSLVATIIFQLMHRSSRKQFRQEIQIELERYEEEKEKEQEK